MNIKKNDNVLILTGKDSGKTGKVIACYPADNKVKVEGINVQKKSKKARSAKETSGIIEQVGAIDASNAMVICPECGKATRVGYTEVDGKKVRICKKCGQSLDRKETKATKTAKKTTKKAEKAPVAEEAVQEKPKRTRKKKTEESAD